MNLVFKNGNWEDHLHVCLSANSRAIYYFCVVGEKEINFIAYNLVIHRGSKCWKDPLISSPYKEIAIREA